MEGQAAKKDIVQQLQREVLSLQGFKKPTEEQVRRTGLGPIEDAFPGQVFPIAAIHEFISRAAEDAAATCGFISCLLGQLMKSSGACLWVSTRRIVFPPALKIFGLDPQRSIFIDLVKQKEALWAIEEALKCEALSVVIGELSELTFTQSRRLQLAVEQSRVTGFIHRYGPRTEDPLACVTRWKITPLPSLVEDGLPGVGFPRWNVQLLKVRNGKPGAWQLEWSAGNFQHIAEQALFLPHIHKRKTG